MSDSYNDESYNVKNKDLSEDLQSTAQEQAPYVRRSLDPTFLPKFLADGASKSGLLTIDYWGNASAGDQTVSVDLNLDSRPLGFVWSLGAVDRDGQVVDDGMGLVTMGDTYALLSTQVFAGTAGVKWNKDTLDLYVRSTNIGYATMVTGYYYYVFYYDDLDVKQYGL